MTQALLARIAELEDEVSYLRSELGLVQDQTQMARLRDRFELTPCEASVLLALYSAGGRTLSHFQLLDALPPGSRGEECSPKLVPVYVCKIRRKLGRGVVETVWGVGFRLSATGLALAASTLGEPNKFSAAA